MLTIDINRLVRTLSPDLRVGLESAAAIATRNANSSVEISHWLGGLLQTPATAAVFERIGAGAETLRRELDVAIADLSRDSQAQLTLSPNVLALAREAWLVASLHYGRSRVHLGDLLTALSSEPSLRIVARAIAPSLRDIDLKALEAELSEADAPATEPPPAMLPNTTGIAADGYDFLHLCCRDMTADARAHRIDPVIGRDRELRQVIDVLMRRRRNNPILVGEAGVGKTAIAEALALAIVAGQVPEMLKPVRLLCLDLSLLRDGAGMTGEFERRLHGVVDAVKASPRPIILFIDDAHSLAGGSQAGPDDAANVLKPSLARGELRTVAATTWGEYKRLIGRDATLARCFQTVTVDEPDEVTAVRMLRGVAGAFKSHHNVPIRDEALTAAVQLSARYIPDRQLPEKAISLIDTAAAAVAAGRQSVPEELGTLRNERELLKVEAAWLENEAETAESRDRLAAIGTRLSRLAAEIEAIETRFAEQSSLAREADRLEALISCADAGGVQPPASAGGGDGGNVTPFPGHPGTREGARAALAAAERNLARLAGETPLIPRAVDREVIAALVARWTGIPVGKLLTDQTELAKSIDARLKERVIGQDAAIARIAAVMRTARAGLSDPRRPPAVFLLVGMPGTGKTETALALADLLCGGSQYLTTISMSEFREERQIPLLLGSPPDVGYGEDGLLTEAVRRRPHGVLLLDEIDKAHPRVQEILCQVFDKGTVRDGEGRDIDVKNTAIVMTARTGAELVARLAADPNTMPEAALEKMLLRKLQKHFKPAFLDRTTILPFMPLTRQALSDIVDIQVDRIRDRVGTSYGTEVTLLPEAREALVGRAGTSEIGGHAIETMIARDVLPVLSAFFLAAVADRRRHAGIAIGFDGEGFRVVGAPTSTAAEFAAPPQRRADTATSNGTNLHDSEQGDPLPDRSMMPLPQPAEAASARMRS